MIIKKSIKSFIFHRKIRESLKYRNELCGSSGTGDPNEENGEYKKAIGLLYGISFTIKMSYKGSHSIEGYFFLCGTATGRTLVAGGQPRMY